MGQWFRTPRQKFWAAFLVVMTLAFGALTLASYGSGEQVMQQTYSESQFEKEELDTSQAGSFSLEERSLCMLEVEGLTLDQSWLWVKVMILDDQGRPVYDYKFDLSYYHGVEGGESWSEGSKDDYKVFVLPRGDYQVVTYAEDEPSSSGVAAFGGAPITFSNGYNTIDRNERIRVTVKKDVMLTRYYLTLLILFGVAMIGYFWIRSERSALEAPTSYDYQ